MLWFLKVPKMKNKTRGEKTTPAPTPVIPNEAIKKKKNKGSKKKRLEALLSYHNRLVEEKGLPPSRLMLKQASVTPNLADEGCAPQGTRQFKCDQCEYET